MGEPQFTLHLVKEVGFGGGNRYLPAVLEHVRNRDPPGVKVERQVAGGATLQLQSEGIL